MDDIQQLQEILIPFMPLIIIMMIWDTAWKLIGMWKAGRNNHLVWFLCIALINSFGILPIIYILINKGKIQK